MNEKLYPVLLAWRARLLELNLVPPTEADVERICETAPTWPTAPVSDAAVAWQGNITDLMRQVRLGVKDPVAYGGSELWVARPGFATTPAQQAPASNGTQAPSASAAPQGNQPGDTATALRQWLALARAAHPGDDALQTFPAHRLGQLISSGGNLRVLMESNGLGAYIDEVAQILAGGAAPAPEPPSPEPSAIPLPGAPAVESGGAAPAAPVGNVPSPSSPPQAAAAAAPPPVTTSSPAAPTTAPIAAPGQLFEHDPASFALCDYSRMQDEQVPISVATMRDGRLTLTWPEPLGDAPPVRIYRAVAGDDVPPWSPESGRAIAITSQRTTTDGEPFTSPVRHLQIWCNEGNDLHEALTSQPYLFAETSVVAAVREFRLWEDSGSVIGAWQTFPGIERVQVYRIPIEQATRGSRSPMYRICAADLNLRGFHDESPERGKRYLYQAVVEVSMGDKVLVSDPVSLEQQLSVVLRPVSDLKVSLFDDDADQAFFELVWTAPTAGEVAIYRTEMPPVAGIQDKVQELSRLAGANLVEDAKLGYPSQQVAPGRDGIRRVPWPSEWSRAYFTPVTVLGGMGYVGTTASATRVPPVQDAQLKERVNEQLLTFSWPAGAAAVWVYIDRPDRDPRSVIESRDKPDYEIPRDDWSTYGGLHFHPPLSYDPCALYLVSVAFHAGKPVSSAPVRVNYPGLRVIRYATTIKRSMLGGRPSKIGLTLRSESDNNPPMVFALIVNRDRFPLHIKDGDALPLRVADIEGGAPSSTVIRPDYLGRHFIEPGWEADLEGFTLDDGHPYFLRLFLDAPPHVLAKVAVIDPPIDNLRLRKE